MKKLVIVLVLTVLIGFSLSAQAQGPKMAISINPIAIIINTYAGSFEYAFTNNLSAKLDLSFSPNVAWFTGIGMFGVNAEVRYYFFGGAVGGFFAGAGGGFGMVFGSYDLLGSTYSFTGFVPDVLAEVGYKWVLGKNGGFYLEPYVGYEFAFGTITETIDGVSSSAAAPFGGFLYGLNLGWAF